MGWRAVLERCFSFPSSTYRAGGISTGEDRLGFSSLEKSGKPLRVQCHIFVYKSSFLKGRASKKMLIVHRLAFFSSFLPSRTYFFPPELGVKNAI